MTIQTMLRAPRRRGRAFFTLAALAALAATLASPQAQAIDLAFSITTEPAPPFFHYYHRPHVPGTVTGILRGLADDGSASVPTAIDFTSGFGPVGLTATHVTGFSTVMGSLSVRNGVVDPLLSSLHLNFADPVVGGLMLVFNSRDNFYGHGINVLAWNGGSGPVVSIGNQRGVAGANLVPLTAVPEPGRWALLLAGGAWVAWAAKRRRAHPPTEA
jgi:hypothetical protein